MLMIGGLTDMRIKILDQNLSIRLKTVHIFKNSLIVSGHFIRAIIWNTVSPSRHGSPHTGDEDIADATFPSLVVRRGSTWPTASERGVHETELVRMVPLGNDSLIYTQQAAITSPGPQREAIHEQFAQDGCKAISTTCETTLALLVFILSFPEMPFFVKLFSNSLDQ